MTVVDTFVSQVASVSTPETVNNASLKAESSSTFDPSKHLQFVSPSKVWSMKELQFPEDQGISPVSVSEPFRLFSDQAVHNMRNEIFSKKVWSNHRFASKYAECQLRGYARDHAPFIYSAWKSPETLAIISRIAGIDLVPLMDYEIAHINISGSTVDNLNPLTESTNASRETSKVIPAPSPSESVEEKNDAIVSWHKDSYPFVCVTMLSDCTNMVGGETALKTGTGQVIKVRGPGMGYAVVLQGRYIDHQALRAFGGTERISMVTSFRARSSGIKDDTVLKLVRPISNIDELYEEYSEYRFQMMEDRFREARQLMTEKLRNKAPYSVAETKAFIREQIEFLQQMDEQIIEHVGGKIVS
ncbi:hypothetical protein G7Z17_g808 [Cylindrodendrum hubeiense]|uniref:Uncharacterized protein n=1 Tax=Cylindrodendrum hubeiense TaxID=595255 RepID=A0A9P5HG33_9HYPO|nr:hypothetical protein G7Z17_g808 [Cylindrodendrum hubeiense]